MAQQRGSRHVHAGDGYPSEAVRKRGRREVIVADGRKGEKRHACHHEKRHHAAPHYDEHRGPRREAAASLLLQGRLSRGDIVVAEQQRLLRRKVGGGVVARACVLDAAGYGVWAREAIAAGVLRPWVDGLVGCPSRAVHARPDAAVLGWRVAELGRELPTEAVDVEGQLFQPGELAPVAG